MLGLYEHAALAAVVALHLLAAVFSAVLLGIDFEVSLFAFLLNVLLMYFPLYVLAMLIWQFFLMILVDRPESPLRLLGHRIWSALKDYEQHFRSLVALCLFAVFVACFSHLKVIIPQINPFSWDPLLATIDRVLHFSRDPYEWLMPILGTPLLTSAINFIYNAWFFLMYLIVLLSCFTRYRPESRMTFLIAFVLTWAVGGNLLAIVFSSAGPVFYEPLGFGDDFVPLMAALNRFSETYPVWALGVQEALWEGYVGEGPLLGISAMPSMHLASSTLLAIYAFQHSRWAGWVLTFFTGIVLLGSVHLAWHYAIDGYAGILIALVFWKVAEKMARTNIRWTEEKRRRLGLSEIK